MNNMAARGISILSLIALMIVGFCTDKASEVHHMVGIAFWLLFVGMIAVYNIPEMNTVGRKVMWGFTGVMALLTGIVFPASIVVCLVYLASLLFSVLMGSGEKPIDNSNSSVTL